MLETELTYCFKFYIKLKFYIKFQGRYFYKAQKLNCLRKNQGS